MADTNAALEKQKVKEITDRLEEGLTELFESEKYKGYLTTMSRFHNYSFNNTLLIAMQKPEASLVAGYRAWQKNFNRHVKKGERGIRILAPAPYTIREERDKLDPVTGELMFDADGMPMKEDVEVKIPAFRAVSVFDISQTDGEPLSELEPEELLSAVDGYEDFVRAVRLAVPTPIEFEDIPGDSRGYFSPSENRIAVQEGMSESQTLKTMVHEAAHSILHSKEVNEEDILAPANDRNTREVEAESVAYTVCSHFGIDTSGYSFGYIAGWSSGKDMKELKSSLDTIRRTASEMITGIEGQLQELQRNYVRMKEMSADGPEEENVQLMSNSEGSLQAMQTDSEERSANKEAKLLYGDTDTYGIYQLKDSPELRDYHFAGTAELLKRNLLSDDFREIQPGNYNLVYTGELSEIDGQEQVEKLNAIYVKFNIDHPKDFNGHSLSVSDIVVLHDDGETSAHFVDSYGFTELPEFTRTLEDEKTQEADKSEGELNDGEKQFLETDSTPLRDIEQARAAEDQEEGIAKGVASGHDVQKQEAAYLLPNDYLLHIKEGDDGFSYTFFHTKTKQKDYEGAISRKDLDDSPYSHLLTAARTIAQEDVGMAFIPAAEVSVRMLSEYPGSDVRRREMFEPESLPKEDVRVIDSGYNELFRIPDGGYLEIQYPDRTFSAKCEHIDEYHSYVSGDCLHSCQFAEILERNGGTCRPENEIDAHEAAWRAGRNNYLAIQTSDEGYDYTLYDADFHEVDGGRIDNPAISIKEARNEILECNGMDRQSLVSLPYDFVAERGEQAARADMAEKMAALQSDEPLLWDMKDEDEIIDLGDDREQVLADMKKTLESGQEKGGSAGRIKPPGSAVADFKAKTDELFHDISEMNPAEIEEAVRCHVQAILDETGMDAVIVDAAVTGSRCRGLEREGSDLDVVVELSTDEREDALFEAFNEDGLRIGGIKVDINPITAQRTGTLESFLPQVEEYLEGVREARENEPASNLNIRMNDGEVTLTVAECGEFHGMGEFYENIPTVDEALAIWKQIPPERMNGIPSIGIHIHKPDMGEFGDAGADILSGDRIDLGILEYFPDIKESQKAMEVIAELVAKAMSLVPEMEIDGKMSAELEASVWEKRMPDLAPAQQLAAEIDRFAFGYDADGYHDSRRSMTENVLELADALKQGDTEDIAMWLADIASDKTDLEESGQARELLEKLAEYKPLAKIEENAINGMEEQNYNRVDNMQETGRSSFPNAAGEKAGKEENGKAQERPAAKPSLRARLAEKKAQAAGCDNEKSNSRMNRREIS